jgi:hypothetical protein
MCYLLGLQGLLTIPGMGKKRIVQGIQEHETIEKLLAGKKVFLTTKDKKDYLQSLKTARETTAKLLENPLPSIQQCETPSGSRLFKVRRHRSEKDGKEN